MFLKMHGSTCEGGEADVDERFLTVHEVNLKTKPQFTLIFGQKVRQPTLRQNQDHQHARVDSQNGFSS
jgi:hypothetical protein